MPFAIRSIKSTLRRFAFTMIYAAPAREGALSCTPEGVHWKSERKGVHALFEFWGNHMLTFPFSCNQVAATTRSGRRVKRKPTDEDDASAEEIAAATASYPLVFHPAHRALEFPSADDRVERSNASAKSKTKNAAETLYCICKKPCGKRLVHMCSFSTVYCNLNEFTMIMNEFKI